MVELKRELEGRADEQAADAEAPAARKLDEDLLALKKEHGILQRTLSPVEWIRQTDAWIETHREWPALSDEALQREDWYGERG